MIETQCMNCGTTIAPDKNAIMLGPSVWRYCAACRGQSADSPRGPAVCPHCGHWLKSGAH
jgi:DNA-directed RNA polymerase subunit RPC12/RpoP